MWQLDFHTSFCVQYMDIWFFWSNYMEEIWLQICSWKKEEYFNTLFRLLFWSLWSCNIIRNICLVFVQFLVHRTPKTLGISWVIGWEELFSLLMISPFQPYLKFNELTLGGPQGSFRTGVDCQEPIMWLKGWNFLLYTSPHRIKAGDWANHQ